MKCPHCGGDINDGDKLVWGPVTLYVSDRLVFVGNSPRKVTKSVFNVIRHAMEHPQRIMTADIIAREHRTADIHHISTDDETAKQAVYRANKQLGVKLFVPEWGVGYRLNGELLNG
jgi:DNA-binding response OmpR family regulator